MNVPQIKNIEQLFQLGSGDKIKKEKIQLLTAPGENYGSVMLSVELNVETPKGDKHIHSVVKMVPPNELLQKIFNTKVTFRSEIAFYKDIVPLLQNFQKENGIENVIDFTPEYLGSRLNLKDDCDEVDADAALVLENLKMKNFITLERTQGLDFNTAKLILTNLAHLHAVSLGLKLKKLEIFEKEIKPYLHGFRPDENLKNIIRGDLIKIIDQIEELVPLKDRILEGFDKMVLREPREPFATLLHDDCWVNNNMIKFEGTTAIENKMVDYQLCSYGSPAKDVLFFLFSSVKNEVVPDKYDEMLKLYHKNFVSMLEKLHCETERFSFENFLKEIDFEAKWGEFGHIAFMLIPIFGPRQEVKELSEIKPGAGAEKKVSDLHRKKFIFVVNEFLKKNWI